MLPQNTTLWHIQYFKVKESENQQVQKGFRDLPLKQIIRPLCEKFLVYTWRKGAFLSPRTGEGERNPGKHFSKEDT